MELGVKFISEVAGTVTGVRFYKSAGNTGTHIGNLWSSTGTPLATGTFTGETASGWQQMNFASPVTIAANTTYVVSYFAPNGHYSGNLDYFATQLDNPPLHAPGERGVGRKRRVRDTARRARSRATTYRSLNYWVDVVFSAQATAQLTSIAVTPAESGGGDRQGRSSSRPPARTRTRAPRT